MAKVGIPWTEEEFLSQSLLQRHPLQGSPHTDDAKRAAFDILIKGRGQWLLELEVQVRHWGITAEVTAEEEERFHKSLNPRVEKAVEHKRLLLFKDMLKGARHEDMSVADLMYTGTPTVGDLDVAGIFEERRPEDVVEGADPRWLWATAKESREARKRSWADKQCDDTVRELYAITVDNENSETKREWALGPFTEEEVAQRLGKCFLPVRRFEVKQKDKVQPIDDFSAFFHNTCVVCMDKVAVSGVDGIASMVRMWAELIHEGCAKSDKAISIKLGSEEILQGKLHPDIWKSSLAGTCVDLESEYKQLVVAPKHSSFSVLSLQNMKTGNFEFFEALALPFGASAAVHGFNRAAQAYFMV